MIKQIQPLVRKGIQSYTKRGYCSYFEKRNNNTPYSTEPLTVPNPNFNHAGRYLDKYNKHKTFVSFNKKDSVVTPLVLGLYARDNSEFVAPSASILGNVHLGPSSSVWYNSVVRADVNYIHIGAYTNIQDGTVVREATGPLSLDHNGSTIIGDYTTVGHNCILEACTIEEDCLIGMNSILEAGSYVEAYSIVGSNSVLPSGTRVKSGQLWAGSPAKYVRDLTDSEKYDIHNQSIQYSVYAQEHQESLGLNNESFVYQSAEEQGIEVGWKGEYFETEEDVILQQQIDAQNAEAKIKY